MGRVSVLMSIKKVTTPRHAHERDADPAAVRRALNGIENEAPCREGARFMKTRRLSPAQGRQLFA
jgi:hypothetical protein